MDWGANAGFALLVTGLPDEPVWLARPTLALHAGKLLRLSLFNTGFLVLLVVAIVAGLQRRFRP